MWNLTKEQTQCKKQMGKYYPQNVINMKSALDLEERETKQDNYLEHLIGCQHMEIPQLGSLVRDYLF